MMQGGSDEQIGYTVHVVLFDIQISYHQYKKKKKMELLPGGCNIRGKAGLEKSATAATAILFRSATACSNARGKCEWRRYGASKGAKGVRPTGAARAASGMPRRTRDSGAAGEGGERREGGKGALGAGGCTCCEQVALCFSRE